MGFEATVVLVRAGVLSPRWLNGRVGAAERRVFRVGATTPNDEREKMKKAEGKKKGRGGGGGQQKIERPDLG
jgi:hypothetical protein